MSVGSFAVGLRFYYWDYYKSIKEMPSDEREAGMINHHSGYDVSDLYVPKKYDSFGKEIDNYRYIKLNSVEFKKLVMTKAKKFMETKLIKSIKSYDGWYRPRHYNIPKKSSITLNHVLSIILYTDFSELSSNFTSSFRACTPYQTLSQIKARNSNYWWWSKSLREVVELFGDRVDNEYPICYTGMSVVMNIPSFRMRLCSPTSTSTQIEVAMKFAGSQGMILQLQTKGIMWLDYVRAFDCSYISRYSEEEERYALTSYSYTPN